MRRVDVHHTQVIFHHHFHDAYAGRQPGRFVVASQQARMDACGAPARVHRTQRLESASAPRGRDKGRGRERTAEKRDQKDDKPERAAKSEERSGRTKRDTTVDEVNAANTEPLAPARSPSGRICGDVTVRFPNRSMKNGNPCTATGNA